MTHKPPVPAASQSPYPLHPTPVQPQKNVRARVTNRMSRPQQAPPRRFGTLTIGIVIAAAAVGLLLLRRR